MAIFTKIKKKFYQDSLKLMRVSSEIKDIPGIEQAFAFMATEINKKTRMQGSLMNKDVEAAEADDLVIIVQSADNATGEKAIEQFEKQILSSANVSNESTEEAAPATFEQAKKQLDANLAIISVPGTYAAVQTLNALSQGLNVMLFSDNVLLEDEIAIKDYAISKDLLVMGPDCGTAIIGGVPLCFANHINKGDIGVIGASGTGTQEFTVLLDNFSAGITHAIGTGGRDLSKEVAARTTLAALKLMEKDEATKVIAIISKPPAQEVAQKVIEAVKTAKKPAVLAFLGEKSQKIADNIYVAGTIEEAAAKALALSQVSKADEAIHLYQRESREDILGHITKLEAGQKAIKGLFTGGTLASEAKHILKGLKAEILDLGDDEYTRGALHPMIDPTNRKAFIEEAFVNDDVAVILCDVVLGYGSHEDPAGELAKAVASAKGKIKNHKIVIASVTGTENDPQVKSGQVKKLEEVGIFVLPSNQYAAELSLQIINKINGGA
ncbi:MAG: acyl-CoA synthetase FdrA [Spirochaetaceae bacterium]|nr:acyl-CoA synthetase FdrA [Spirochaetaceae bacterium]